MIRHKLAEMAIRIFSAESMTYRVEGLIDSQLEGFSWDELWQLNTQTLDATFLSAAEKAVYRREWEDFAALLG